MERWVCRYSVADTIPVAGGMMKRRVNYVYEFSDGKLVKKHKHFIKEIKND